jgi:hypothetical protein
MEGEIQMKNYTAIYFCSLLTTPCEFSPRHYHYTAVYPCSLCTVAFVFPPTHNHYTGAYFLSLITLPCVFPHRHYMAYRILNSVQILLLPLICAMYNTLLTKKNFVASVLASEYIRFKKNYPILNFQAMCHTTGNLLCYTPLIHRHLISGYTERCGKWFVYPDNRASTLSVTLHWIGQWVHWVLLLRWWAPQDRCTLGFPGCSSVSVSQNHKILKHLEQTLLTDVSLWL